MFQDLLGPILKKNDCIEMTKGLTFGEAKWSLIMERQNLINTIFGLLLIALLFHGVQLNNWVVENRERIDLLEK